MQSKTPGILAEGLFAPNELIWCLSLHHAHATHSAHAHTARHAALTIALFLLRELGDTHFRAPHHDGTGGLLLPRCAYRLGRIDDTVFNQIFIGVRFRIVTEGALFLLHAFSNNGTVFAGIKRNAAN